MGIIVLYLGMVVVGYPIGAMLRKKNIEFKGVNAVEMVTIAFLVFMMGARIGANDEVISSLDTIGLEAFVLVVLALAGSVTCVFALRKFFGFDRMGGKKND